MMIDFSVATASDLEKHKRHFPSGADMTLQLLRGHLLVEELLRELLVLQLAFPDAIKSNGGASFSCHQVICLVQAITRHSDTTPWLWVAARKLNRIRNDLAHKLNPQQLQQDVTQLINYVFAENPEIREDAKVLGIPDGHELELVVLSMCTCLSSLKAVLAHLGQGGIVA